MFEYDDRGPSMSISTEDLTKAYGGTKARDGVSISVDQGDILGVVGNSGSANFLVTGWTTTTIPTS
jgi:ABC-type transporter Mla maintaining outer membrane lipid asymmetry ATPase subunit MlaF